MAVLGVRIKCPIYADSPANAKARFDQCHAATTRVGDAVRQGDPVGVTGARRSNITVELRRNGRPVDIIPLVGLA